MDLPNDPTHMQFLHSLDIDGIRCGQCGGLTCSEHTQLFSLDSNQVNQIVKHSIETKVHSIYNRPWSRGNHANPLDEGSPPFPVMEGNAGNSVPYEELRPASPANAGSFQPSTHLYTGYYTNTPYYFGNMTGNEIAPNVRPNHPMPSFEPVPKRNRTEAEAGNALEEIVDSSMDGRDEMIDLVDDSSDSSDVKDVEYEEGREVYPSSQQQIPSNVIFDIDSNSDSFSVCNKHCSSPHLLSHSMPPYCLQRPPKNCQHRARPSIFAAVASPDPRRMMDSAPDTALP